ncbi:hypothetical protein GCM10027271_26170 [Saccharopolyspora gloriosae]|uniref:Tetratricopeptide repeat protein n=1 Tax=Saccharopolyspora gloriosae TaxID=455344 RepID=A0A840NJ05_9PSEU|nr:hypothetical protein [Saccharopolyspora gloriosae]MBB5071544.1 hypothetical protein [Saccharopolyspora gloriosae]
MGTVRQWLRPWVVAAIGGLVAVGIVEGIADGGRFPLAALGALAGVIVLPMITQLGLLTGAAVFGLRIRHIVIGSLRGIASWRVGRTTITLRMLPLELASEIGPWRSPVILRCWLAGLVSALAGVAAVAVSWSLADGPFGRGVLVAVTPLMLYKLWPRRAPLATSTGWLLFGLPRMPEPRRTEFRAGPLAACAHEALLAGDVTRAQAATDRLTAAHPGLNTTINCQVTMLEAHGEYAQAVLKLVGHIAAADIDQREMSYTLAGLAGLGFSAAEAGQLPAAEVLPIAKKALDDAIGLGYPAYQLSGTKALLALLEDDPDEAARLAAIGADHNTSPLSKADDYATLARAHMARHDNAAAREALAKADELAAWWPRVRGTRERLSVA